MINNLINYFGIGLSVLNAGLSVYLMQIHKKMNTPKYYAVFVNPTTKKTDYVKEIKNFDRVVTYKDQTYNIVADRFVDVPKQKTKYFLYVIGESDPVDVTDFSGSLLQADVYNGIIENEMIKKMTRASSAMKMDPKMLLYAGAGLLLFIFIMANGGI